MSKYLGRQEDGGPKKSLHVAVSPLNSGSSSRMTPGKGRVGKGMNPRRSMKISKLSKQESDKDLSPGARGLPGDALSIHVRSNKDLKLDRLVKGDSTSSSNEGVLTQEKQ